MIGNPGYQAPNHTQVPNTLLDEHMQTMGEAELKVVLVVVRKTLGWHKRRDKISLSQLMEATGLSRSAVTDGINHAMERGLVRRFPDGQSFSYELNIWEPELVANSYQSEKATSSKSGPALVAISDQLPSRELVANSATQKKPVKEKLKKEEEEIDSLLSELGLTGGTA